MPTQKKFFIYAILLILFFIFSQLMISGLINTTYKYKSVDIKSEIPLIAEVQASAVSGFAKVKVLNNTPNSITDKYIKIDCYSKNDTLMGTKYIKVENVESMSTAEYEVKFNYDRVEKAVIDMVDELPANTPEEDLISDPQMILIVVLVKLIILSYVL